MDSAFARALSRFQDGLTNEEVAQFQFSSIDDVWTAVEYLQREQSSRNSMRNMARLAPFIHGLSRYSGVIEVFVQGKPEIMAFIWGPLKLLLQVCLSCHSLTTLVNDEKIASNYENHFEKLLDAFQSIGENLPRFRKYQNIFQYDQRLQEVITMVYADIMEFFRRMWKFFRRRAWHIVLDTLWSDFQGRFQVILGNLKRHNELLDKEAHSCEMQEASIGRKLHEQILERIGQALEDEIGRAADARRRAEAEIDKSEKDRMERQKATIFGWIDSIDCRDDKERAGRRCHPNTGLWVFDCQEFADWFVGGASILWLTGKPGCGKTVLSYTMIQELQANRKEQVVYFFFDYKDMSKNNLLFLLRALTSQLLMLNPDLLSFASQWVYQGPSSHASLTALKDRFSDIVAACPRSVYVVIDGLDECEAAEVSSIQAYLRQLVLKHKKLFHICIASREISLVKGFKGVRITKLKIGNERNGDDIQSFVTTELQRLQEELEPHIVLTDEYLSTITQKLASLSDGMFLWARLVIEGLYEATTVEEIKLLIDELPPGLDQA